MSKTLVITGGTSLIGESIVRLFHSQGFNIVFTYHTSYTKAETLASDLGNHNITKYQLDLADNLQLLRFVEYLSSNFNSIDVLINNGAMLPARRPVEEYSWEEIDQILFTNTNATFKLCHGLLSLMRQNGGSIINISSEAAKFGGNQMTLYSASKGALNSFILGFAREVGKYHIRVNNISPAIIKDEQEVLPEELLKTLPLGRAGYPIDVANTAYWLCQDSARYISGTTLTISGGR
ncbi:SDR family NAD(P)-dependent oxidoreductase [Rickettsiales endosymbiont of Stachyamoeba lipophora]|uniref:SDR family NAD(P)-dependent oxidoreductase n=1 Tax=Rickettsiales endosymbiont of Stachyamoeba lipophora TaxID=2486578 RepID=UPI000F651D02|nr:SDR family oxidoreductase [Rickettsiales endosymbiont of Stachyamoeba lipophora]AZL15490.1 SDR family oxidoreductase [Rickettsiales endosymbiont of Stachyamoeba lipophora]